MPRLVPLWIIVLGPLVSPGFGEENSPLSPYGVCAHLPRGDEYATARKELRLMREAGIGWARADFSWSGCQRRQGGEWSFDRFDDVVEWAEAEGVRILPILNYDVPWARPAWKHLDLWLEYVERLVGRYKDRIRYWEVWNEPNLEKFWKDRPDAANYVKLLAATHERIKRIDPGLVVVLGGTAGIPWPYLEGVYEAGGAKSFDVMNVHPYRYPASPEKRSLRDDLLRLRRLMAERGDAPKPVWATEIGWPTHQGKRGVTEPVQAQMLARAYLIALEAGVEVVFWYEFQAMERKPDYNEDHFGVVHLDLKPKPAYAALKTLARVRPAGSKGLDGAWLSGEVHRTGWQRPDGEKVWALWSPEQDRELSVRIEGRLGEALDHLGGAAEVRADGGLATLSVGPGPTYLVGPDRVDPR